MGQAIVNGITLGAVYALVGAGFALIFRSTGLFNLAQGHLMVIAPFVVYTLMADHGFSFFVALVAGLALMAMFGGLIHILLLRHLAGFDLASAIMVTVGLTILIEAGTEIGWGSNVFALETPWTLERVDLPWGLTTTNVGIASVVIAVLAIGGLTAMFRWTKFGARLHAASTQPALAALSGININVAFAVAWALAGVLAAVAGMEYASQNLVSPSLIALGLRSFPAALVGGLDSVPGSLVGGLAVGIAESVAVHEFGSDVADVAVFAMLVVMLTVRPNGLLGTPQATRV